MPTLPLFAQTLTAGEPESWHRVTAPGGYESWQFVAADDGRDAWAVASLSWGSTFLPRYLRRYERYRAWPTRFAPPVPKEHCCASFALYDGGRQIVRFDIPVNGDEFNVSREAAAVSVGANRLTVDPAGRLRLNLRGQPWRDAWYGAAVVRHRTVSANLTFEPLIVGNLREMELLNGESPVHRWAVSRPVCKVSGEVTIFEGAASTPVVVKIEGRGCHEHTWGIRPLAWDFTSAFRGHVLDEGRTFAFEHLQKRRSRGSVTRLVGIDATGSRDVEVNAEVMEWKRVGIGASRYPTEIRFGEVLKLQEPRVLAASLFDVRLIYTARWADRTAKAICQSINWKRLRSIVMGKAIALGVGKA